MHEKGACFFIIKCANFFGMCANIFIQKTNKDCLLFHLYTQSPNNQVTFTLTGQPECISYFGILSNGGLYVRQDLVPDTRTQYIVSRSAKTF